MFFLRKRKRVMVGVSGGVDSALSLWILKFLGYDVTGVFIKTWQPDFIKCTWPEERRDAISVCAKVGVPFLDLDLENAYKEKVADYMISSYKSGITPNPDILCNQEIKFGEFYNFAQSKKFDFVATGHYARIKRQNNNILLLRGKDRKKDQSYFLAMIPKEKLPKIIFPIGFLNKKQVRFLARLINLPVYNKKDSQGICFLGMVKMEDFLGNYIVKEKGLVVNQNGEEIGYHQGVKFYTVGQRHGFILNNKSSSRSRMYILKKDIIKNELIVGPKASLKQPLGQVIKLDNFNFFQEEFFKTGNQLDCQIRYQGELKTCQVTSVDLGNKKIEIFFSETDLTIAYGQAIVFYHQDSCLGAGIIS